jgi:LEA14-like dessication related protein
MRKFLLLAPVLLLLNGCSALSELSAFSKCEFRLYSLSEPRLCGIDVSHKRSWRDFTLREGQIIALYLLGSSLPFDIQVYVEARNPGSTTAAVKSIQWIAYVDDVKVAKGKITDPVEIPPNGRRVVVPLAVHADLIDFMEGDRPKTLMNFAMTLFNAGEQNSQLRLKIKPSIQVGSQTIKYPGYFTVTTEFSSGN